MALTQRTGGSVGKPDTLSLQQQKACKTSHVVERVYNTVLRSHLSAHVLCTHQLINQSLSYCSTREKSLFFTLSKKTFRASRGHRFLPLSTGFAFFSLLLLRITDIIKLRYYTSIRVIIILPPFSFVMLGPRSIFVGFFFAITYSTRTHPSYTYVCMYV